MRLGLWPHLQGARINPARCTCRALTLHRSLRCNFRQFRVSESLSILDAMRNKCEWRNGHLAQVSGGMLNEAAYLNTCWIFRYCVSTRSFTRRRRRWPRFKAEIQNSRHACVNSGLDCDCCFAVKNTTFCKLFFHTVTKLINGSGR